MKKIVILFLVAFSGVISAQTLSIEETKRQIKMGDSLSKSGNNLLIEFICTQDTARHTQAYANFKAAKMIYDSTMAHGTVQADDWGTTVASLLDSKIMIAQSNISLYGNRFRENIMAETVKDRTKKVKYNGVEYKLGKYSKQYFDILNG